MQAQREACEAFINSQRHEGWVCLPAYYDDGGFSGATIDRPALQRLLADITAGRVDIASWMPDIPPLGVEAPPHPALNYTEPGRSAEKVQL